ncbi:MAG TPA: 23S rRNA (adenine(2503)-C(2))-methyltransferase RlmN [Planctomycetota bacterium]|jgi:23S rRNA (adenine2503-C2)-methyltransferase
MLHGLTLPQLTQKLAAHSLPAHQARLTFQAIHRHGVLDPEKMPGISERCRNVLLKFPPLPRLSVTSTHAAEDGTLKLQLATPAGELLECVIIPSQGGAGVSAGRHGGRHHPATRVTLCLSCQIGCAAGCSFCFTGTMKLQRNLEPWEITEQFRLASQHAPRPITNLVFMGMGEPFHNEAHVLQACRIFGEDIGAGFSRRHIVVSTAGVGNRIRPFWETGAASLSLSLHATTDEVRNTLVPLNRRWNLDALRKILLDIPWRKNETITIAYLLLSGVNDSQADAQRLADWCRGLPAKVNLLDFNAFPGGTYAKVSDSQRAAFRQWLHDYGVFHTLRHSRGDDVMAACGQLAARRR